MTPNDPVSREKVLEAVLAEMDRYSADTFGKHDRDDMIAAINAVHAAPPAQGWTREELAKRLAIWRWTNGLPDGCFPGQTRRATERPIRRVSLLVARSWKIVVAFFGFG